LDNFPFEAEAKPLKQTAIMQTHYSLAGLHIDRDPAPLRPRILHDFNSTHRNIPVIGWVADKNNTQTQLKRDPTLFFPFQNKPCGATGNN